MRSLLPLAMLFLITSFLCQCATLVQTEEDYSVSGNEPNVNGARMTAEFMTTDGRVNYSLSAMVYFVAGETETGPYKCLFSAWGERGTHRSMTVEKLTFRTAGGQTATAPPSTALPFAPGAKGEGWQATYVVPGILDLDFENDGEVTIDATVAVRSNRRNVRRNIRLTMTPAESKDVRFATILDEFRKDKEERDEF